MESCRTPLLEAWKVVKSGIDPWGPLGELEYQSFHAGSGANGSFHQLLSRKKACRRLNKLLIPTILDGTGSFYKITCCPSSNVSRLEPYRGKHQDSSIVPTTSCETQVARWGISALWTFSRLLQKTYVGKLFV